MKRALLGLLLAAPLTAQAQDTTPPQITVEQPTAGACVGGDATVRVTVADAGSGVDAGTVAITANGNAVTSAFTPCSDVTAAWSLRKAIKLGTSGTSAHAFWLPQLPGGPQYLFEGDGSFVEYANGTAHLTGTIVSRTHATKRWRVDLWYVTSTASPKLELQKKHYLDKGGPIDPATWRYYELDETRANLTGLGDFAGKSIQLYARPTNKVYKFQVGDGANGKNLNLGGSGWLGYTGDYTGNKGDINVDFLPAACLQSTVGQLGAEGPITLGVTASDLSGNPATSQVAFEADLTGPSVTVTPATAAVVEEGATELTIAFSDAGCGVDASSLQVTLDGQDVTAQFTVNGGQATATINLTAGSHTLSAMLTDTVGNPGFASSTFEVGLTAVALELRLAPGDPNNLLINTENDLTIRAVTASGTTATNFVGTVQLSVTGGQAPLLNGMLVPFTAGDAGSVTVDKLAFFESIGDFVISGINLAAAPDDIAGSLNVRATVGAPVVNAFPQKTVDPLLPVSGYAFANAQVELLVDGQVLDTVTAGSDGAFAGSVTLVEGPNQVYAQAIDPFDGQTKPSQTQTVNLICQTIVFADPNLEAAVREAISKPTGPITPLDVQGMTYLNASSRGISDLSGLECLLDLTHLLLASNQISDVGPIGCLTKLNTLNLQSNQITDVSTLNELTQLQSLACYQNQIADVSALAGMTSLVTLDAFSNQISDLTPLAGLTDLVFLRLHTNQISDVTPLAGLTNLTYLGLDSNQLVSVSPLAGLTNLVTLRMTSNQISDVSALSGLNKLQTLACYQNQVVDISALAGMTSLVTLDAFSNQISDLTPLAGLTDLVFLRLHTNQISDVTPLAGLTNLTYLGLDSNQLVSVSSLAGLTNLVTLRMTWNQISDVSALSGLDKLQTLACYENQIVDISALAGMTSLATLDAFSNQISDLTPLATLTDLVFLRLHTNQISDVTSLAGLINLTYLGLDSNQIVSVSSLAGLTNLVTLRMTWNQISDVSALSGLDKLRTLACYENQIVDVSALAGMTSLTTLDAFSNQISDLTPLLGLPLTYLRVSNNPIPCPNPVIDAFKAAGATVISDCP